MYNTKSEPKVTYRLWLIIMCQNRLINCNKVLHQCKMFIIEENWLGDVWRWDRWELSAQSAFCFSVNLELL